MVKLKKNMCKENDDRERLKELERVRECVCVCVSDREREREKVRDCKAKVE